MEQISEETVDNMEQSQADMLNEILLNTQEQCQIMDQVLRRQIEKKDEQIDLLHKELQYYKEGPGGSPDRSGHEGSDQAAERDPENHAVDEWDRLDADKLRQVIAYLEEDIVNLLEMQDIDAFTSEPGELFDPGKHQLAAIIPTEDEDLDRRIQMSRRPGYRKKDKVLVHESVTVYRR